MTTRLRAVFFDAGGTLIYPRVGELAEEVTALGFPASVEDFRVAERMGKKKLEEWLWPKIENSDIPPQADSMYWLEYVRALLERLQVPVHLHGVVTHRIVERFRDLRFWSEVFPDTEPLLQVLRAQRYYLGVISNSIGTIEEQLGRVGLVSYFRTVLDSALVGVEKPNPGIFQIALDRAGVSAQEALFVGDLYSTDIGGARLAGIRGVLMDRFDAYDDTVACPRITSFDALPQVLERLATAP
jgi:putative hydrolase of the HAD superfamily